MDRRKLVDKRSGYYSVKSGSALDGLMGKLDTQLKAENQRKTNFVSRTTSPLGIAGAITGLGLSVAGKTKKGKRGFATSNPFNPSMSPTLKPRARQRRSPNLPTDPLNMKTRMQKAREARQNAILRRHKGGTTYATGTNEEPIDEVEGDLKDLEANEDFVDDNKIKTMEWTEPDGSKTTLKFDSDGTLIGKDLSKSKK